ncbi:MAG TPA: hypothetical protein VN624_16910 [Rhodanobacter sp.]|nr:hypothetical protein [Rhodanobacter sp.]
MRKPCIALAIAAALIAVPVFANPQQRPNGTVTSIELARPE